MAPKTTKGRRPDGTFEKTPKSSVPATPTLAESLSYLHYPRPFKNPGYMKHHNRRTKNLKTVLTQERERDRAERDRRRGESKNGVEKGASASASANTGTDEEEATYTNIEAPPSILPQKRYCDITGLEAPYTDPATGLRYHDKSVYEVIKTLPAGTVKDYLAARGVNPIVK